MREWVIGRNPVYEVLRARRRQVFRLLVAQGSQEKGRLAEILQMRPGRVPIEWVSRDRLDAYGDGHQGVAVETSGYPYQSLRDILNLLASLRDEPPLLLLLDALQDPQNMGTLLRTAEAVGVHGVFLPLRQTATITPAVVSASSGATEHLFIVQANLVQVIKDLKDAGLWVVGLEGSEEANNLQEDRLDGPLALVVGSEGGGMRDLVRRNCDWLLRLPMRGQVASLNAAVAGSVALYFVWQARQFKY